MERTISVWSDRNIRDQLWRWSTLTGLDISVGRNEMSPSIWQNCCSQYRSFVFCLQEQYPNARCLGLGLCNRNVLFHWAWNFRNFKPEFLLNGKRPMYPLYRITFHINMTARITRTINGSHTSSIVPEWLARERVWWTKSSLLNNYLLPSQRLSSSPLFFSISSATIRLPVHTPTKSGRNVSDTWRSHSILAVQIRSVTETAPKLRLLCLNRSPECMTAQEFSDIVSK